MGICGSSQKGRRVYPQLKKVNLGFKSGQTIGSSMMARNIKQKKPTFGNLPQIQSLQLVTWEGHIAQTKEVQEDGRKYLFLRAIYSNFDQAAAQVAYLYNLSRISPDNLIKFTNLELNNEDDVFYMDRMVPKYDQTLLDLLREDPHLLQSIPKMLLFLETITEILQSLHNQGFAYRFIKPENILFIADQYYLNQPVLKFDASELELIKNVIEKESDFYYYDCILVGVLLIYILNGEKDFSQLLLDRKDEDKWIKQHITSSKLTRIVEKEKEKLIKDNDIPQIIIQLIESLTVYEIKLMNTMKDIYLTVKSIREKGLQTAFRNDSLGAFLQYHSGKQLPNISPWLYFARQNQLHLYNLETNGYHYLKIFRKKKRQFENALNIQVNKICNKFIGHVYDEAHGKNMLSFRREVELFRNLRTILFEYPQFVQVTRSENESFVYLMNNKPLTDEETNDIYYGSYIIYFTEEINQENQPKRIIKILEGPKNFQWRRFSFHFYDPHNHYIYCIPDYQNIFQNGIRFSYFDTVLDKGHFKEGVLRFACSEDIYQEFCALNFKIKKIDFCVEAQHGVFIMVASKNIFILDFNFKCFYSLASLAQLQNYPKNHQADPKRYVYAFETRNQPYALKYYGGNNLSFQNGYLHVLSRKDIETVHSVYQIIPHQACVVQLHCFSLQSGRDLLTLIPKNINLILNEAIIHEQNPVTKVIKTVRSYRCIELLFDSEHETYYLAENERNEHFYLHQVKADSLQSVSKLFRSFTKKVNAPLLLSPIEYFPSEEQQGYVMNYINEEIIQTLQKEFEQRRASKNYFQPKELALLMKIIFRGILQIQNAGLEHGNLKAKSLCFTRKGLIKIQGWYVSNRQHFSSDVLDAVKLIWQLATLRGDVDNFEIAHVEEGKDELEDYPGLAEFLVRTWKQKDSLPKIKEQALVLCKRLMTLNVNFTQLRSDAQVVIWIGYGSNYIIVTHLATTTFQKIEVTGPNGGKFKFSKSCMFTYDYNQTMYISGALKEDLKTQQFYELSILRSKEQLKRLEDIPCPLISPTLVYGEGIVYSIGGYMVTENLSKVATDKVFQYSIKHKQWKELASMSLSLVGSTALYNKTKRKIFVLGGESTEIDLTTEKLIFLVYDIHKNHWDFTVDLSFNSPFSNSRFTKPIVDLLNDNYFVSFEKKKDGYFIEIFELVKGGISLKFNIHDPHAHQIKELDAKEHDFFTKAVVGEDKRTLQDDLSLAVWKDIIFVMDEDTKNLNMFKISDIFQPVFDSIPCSIVGDANLKQGNSFTEDDRSLESFK